MLYNTYNECNLNIFLNEHLKKIMEMAKACVQGII